MKDILNRFGDRFFTRAFWLHFCCWVLFIVYELGMVRLSVGKLEDPYIYIYYYALNITFFYGYLEILNFTFRGRRNKVVAGLCFFALLVIIYMALKLVVDTYLIVNQPNITNPFIYIQKFIPRNLIRGFYFVVLATFYWSAGHISTFRRQAVDALKKQINAQKEKMELEEMLNRSKNAYLQQQINPHMIFNALNFVYSTAQRYSDEAANCIWLLSEIMRFSLEDTGMDGKVSLEKEIHQIENIVAINRYRYDKPIYVELKAVGDFSHLRIIPLILLTLTENVFKHGNLLDSNHSAVISLETTASGQFKFITRNARKTASRYQRTKRLGLENVRIRLDTACAGDYKLDTKQTDNFFELSLTLNL